jgi:homoisocitrate dehydrogenase
LSLRPSPSAGKEVLPAAEKVLLALGSAIPRPEFVPLLAGWEVFQKTGVALPQDTVEALKECDAGMFGSVRSVASHAAVCSSARDCSS